MIYYLCDCYDLCKVSIRLPYHTYVCDYTVVIDNTKKHPTLSRPVHVAIETYIVIVIIHILISPITIAMYYVLVL